MTPQHSSSPSPLPPCKHAALQSIYTLPTPADPASDKPDLEELNPEVVATKRAQLRRDAVSRMQVRMRQRIGAWGYHQAVPAAGTLKPHAHLHSTEYTCMGMPA